MLVEPSYPRDPTSLRKSSRCKLRLWGSSRQLPKAFPRGTLRSTYRAVCKLTSALRVFLQGMAICKTNSPRKWPLGRGTHGSPAAPCAPQSPACPRPPWRRCSGPPRPAARRPTRRDPSGDEIATNCTQRGRAMRLQHSFATVAMWCLSILGFRG